MQVSKVPDNFGLSYTIPLLKVKTSYMSTSLSVNDFRGISISPVVSKLFENAILVKYEHFLLLQITSLVLKRTLVVRTLYTA